MQNQQQKKQITVDFVRKKYLEFFEKKGHKIIPSSPLLPENDSTTLFTIAGMQPLIPYLLGESHSLGKRLANSQKCFRAEDIEEIGDNRHTTFFEMLGNWSLGDYFKKEQIHWIFEFLTKELKLDPKRLYITCFRGNPEMKIPKDEESAKLWQQEFAKVGINAKIVDFPETKGMQEGRIFYYPEKKNWWSRAGTPSEMPVGEIGGPDSEIFYDFGADLHMHENSKYKDKPCHVNCDCGRFVEIGNNVFIQYIKTKEGIKPLSKKNIDFGGGLERLTAAANNNPDIFLLDIFDNARNKLEKLSNKKYKENQEIRRAFRVILDHLRAATFLISDGALPSNKDQGYFTRRVIRRAVRFGHKLGIYKNFCSEIAQTFIEKYKSVYPNLEKNKEQIIKEIDQEESKFRQTLEKGLRVFERETKNIQQNQMITGKQAFYLYQSFGFPIEMTKELAQEKGLKVDEKGFNQELKKHQELSKKASDKKFKGGLADHSEQSIKYHTTTHLLHAALRKILGTHVEQRGSNITPERMRFDFTHPKKMTKQEIQQVQDLVNKWINHDLKVEMMELSYEEAKARGAIGLFENKYNKDKVRVYKIGDVSLEICGGPHVKSTGELGKFKIIKEESSSAGVRRIKAILE